MSKTFKGFEKPPAGKMLQQIMYLESDMGLAYERSIGFYKGPHSHDRPILVCPRGSCRMKVHIPGSKTTFTIDSSQFLWVPKDLAHDDDSISSIYDTMALLPNETFFQAMINENGLSESDQRKLQTEPLLFRKSKWLDDILDRYFFERILNRNSPKGCTYFLEKQIINELARIIFQEKFTARSQSDSAEKSVLSSWGVEVALRFIETNLFEKIDLQQISEVAHLSESSLLRSFKKELKLTPYMYIRQRRLDEAMHLIRTGDYMIGDIAILVGYEDFSAFSKAFREKFGKAPTFYMKKK